MRKRVLSLILGLTICLGLCIQAFAAGMTQAKGEIETDQYKLTFYHPDNYTIAYKTDAFQLRTIIKNEKTGTALVYDEAKDAPKDVPLPVIPLGVDVEISGLTVRNTLPVDKVRVWAWSDPDGDGVYKRRLNGSQAFVWPLLDVYPLFASTDVGYRQYADAVSLGGKYSSDFSALKISSDRLYRLYGANTIINMTVGDDETKQSFAFLVTGESLTTSATEFTDVPAGEWYAGPVAWAVRRSITKGTTSTAFSPNKECTHQEILTFLYRAEGRPASYAKYPGAVAGAYADAINWAYEKKMIDDSFHPSDPCTRADAVMYIWQAFGKYSAEPSAFTDVPAGANYAGAVNWAVEEGITTGYSDNTFRPGSVCNRGQIVAFLHRAYNEG